MRVFRSALLYYAAKKSEDAMNNLKKTLQQDETHVLALLTQVTDGETGTSSRRIGVFRKCETRIAGVH